MKLAKAIEVKLQWKKDNYPPPLADQINADNLGIEALKAISLCRKGVSSMVYRSLSGETKE